MVVLSALKPQVSPHRTLAPRPAPPLTANSAFFHIVWPFWGLARLHLPGWGGAVVLTSAAFYVAGYLSRNAHYSAEGWLFDPRAPGDLPRVSLVWPLAFEHGHAAGLSK